MKICVGNRQSIEYLNKADEIKVQFRDRRAIPDYIEKYPGKTIIVEHRFGDDPIDEKDWKEFKIDNTLARENFYLCLSSLQDTVLCKEYGLKFYLGYPVQTFYELQGLKNLGVSFVKLGAPLFFEMDKVKQIGIPVRAIPNVAYADGLPREDGVCGTWIRPEDVELYEDYITSYEFEDCDKAKEQALFRIYGEKHAWSGELDYIITNINYKGTNRMIPQDFTQHRLNCGQRCQSGSSCKLCYRYLNLANPEKIKEYKEALNL